MKKITCLILTAATILSMAGPIWAGESKTIRVSVTIPALPGINVAPFSLDDVRNRAKEGITDKEKSDEKAKEEEAPMFIVQNDKGRMDLVLKTLYAR